ncbi:diguanylate cyclase domain-containing protein [Hydrogenimonas thermophila]|uniref:Diguanylate cyclase (GGDEF) domain-containing protein n=1 Tax=Hydrogenimonas thermophila TaxID=223786 RepID=A0A1I5TAP7_9BACT|nr:diguanylate cyclase [Hydrogenimonas thermophila]SFP80115.1 diguanylate cyclase (GGDEF) domain-containing protein [Hydrogenimonas thermophila]
MPLLFIFMLFPIFIFAHNITIAVDAIHGKEKAVKNWQPTIDYLNKKLPKYRFELYPFLPTEFSKVKKLIQERKVDFIISPPAMYIDLEVTLGASKILTLVKKNNITKFGSVIITNKSSNIKDISQINKDTRIAAVAPLGFGGWLIGYDTLKKHHIKLNKENIIFFGTQEKVVDAILNNEADVGIIRTGILEELISKNKINLNDIRVLNQHKYEDFPYICSTKLYPEWAFAKTKNVNDKIAREVAITLLTIPEDSNITKSTGYHYHWTVPYDYKDVRELMQRLEVGPYKDQSSKYIQLWINNHKELFYAIIFILILITIFLIYGKYINTKLQKEKKEKEILLEKIKKLAYYDVLTNIPNRLSVMQSFEQILANAQRNNLNIAVMFIDLDGFKTINDTLGHEAGDRVLKDVADIFKSTLRKNDLYGRLGGDEFIVVAQGIDGKENIEKLVRKLLDKINAIPLPSPLNEQFGANIGVVSITPCKDTTVEKLMSESDVLMYDIKRQGKNSYKIKFLKC